MITLEKVCFAYEHEVALRYVNLHIEKGESLVIQGPNGQAVCKVVSPADGICFSERGYTAVLRKRGRGSCVWTDSDGAFGGRSQGENRGLSSSVWN